VRDALQAAGYDVFWDQSTPAGQDWDSWIRERLTGAKLVVVLWTKASVASPNVRHEAIIAREAGKLLPVMVDELAPTDFPMGLFMVQALMVGRTPRQFAAVRARFLDDVRARIGDVGSAALAPQVRRPRKKLIIGLGAAAWSSRSPCSSPGPTWNSSSSRTRHRSHARRSRHRSAPSISPASAWPAPPRPNCPAIRR
jgi:hypothetical protein